MSKKQTSILITLFILVIAVFAGVYLATQTKQGMQVASKVKDQLKNQTATEIPNKDTATSTKKQEPPPPPSINKSGVEIPEEVFNYQGEVVSVDGDTITVSLKATENFIELDQEVKVRTDANTSIIKITTPSQENGLTQPKIENLAVLDIMPGAYVTVTTKQNIKDKTNFLAESVRVIR